MPVLKTVSPVTDFGNPYSRPAIVVPSSRTNRAERGCGSMLTPHDLTAVSLTSLANSSAISGAGARQMLVMSRHPQACAADYPIRQGSVAPLTIGVQLPIRCHMSLNPSDPIGLCAGVRVEHGRSMTLAYA